jgi:hypothetical protein
MEQRRPPDMCLVVTNISQRKNIRALLDTAAARLWRVAIQLVGHTFCCMLNLSINAKAHFMIVSGTTLAVCCPVSTFQNS